MASRGFGETLAITLAAIAASLVVFGLFMAVFAGVSPVDLYAQMWEGSFGRVFSWKNTLTKAAPLILTALCTALPARVGLIVIGGEGSLVLGGLAGVVAGLVVQPYVPGFVTQGMMALAGAIAGGSLMALVGALRHVRGVNPTISSLMLAYIAIGLFQFLVEGPLRDPASLNKPSTYPIDDGVRIGAMFGTDVHWGLAVGIVCCVAAWVLLDHTTFGFAARMVGGNARAAQMAGLPVGALLIVCCFLGGAASGLAGMIEIAAVHTQANASLIAGYGFTGILVSFIARHHPLAIIPAAVLFGGLTASSGVLQRRLHLPDASVLVLEGIIFVMILLFETLYGRAKLPRLSTSGAPAAQGAAV